MRLAITRLARAGAIAAAILAASNTLGATGQPVFATLSEVAFNLAAVFSEAQVARRKIVETLIVAIQAAS